MARRRKKKSNAGKFIGLVLTVMVAGGTGWYFSQTPEKQTAFLGRVVALWHAFQELTAPPGANDDALAGIRPKRPDVTEPEAAAAQQRAREGFQAIQGLEQVPGLDVGNLRKVAELRLKAGDEQMASSTWPLAHAYYDASAEVSEKILKTDKAAIEAFGRRRGAFALRDLLVEKRHPKLSEAKWKATEDKTSEAEAAFNAGNFIEAAKQFQECALAYGEMQAISDQLYRYDKVKAEFVLAMGKTNEEMMNNYGGDLWKEIQALQAQGVALNSDSPTESLEALERALKRLPEAVKLARKAKAKEIYTLSMSAAEAALVSGDLPGARDSFRKALTAEHDQVGPALTGLATVLGRQTSAAGERISIPLENNATLDLVYIAPGTFRMGLDSGSPDEKPAHQVSFAKPFFLGRTEITQAQWLSLLARDPSAEQGKDLPVANVLWDEAVLFTQRASGLRGITFRLPRESEWEYACRAGTSSLYSFGDREEEFPSFGNFCDEKCLTRSLGEKRKDGFTTLSPVASFKSNPWGLFDLHGNVMEWCADRYHPEAYRLATEGKEIPADSGPFRVVRGGSYNFPSSLAASGRRYRYLDTVSNDYIGFRVLLESP